MQQELMLRLIKNNKIVGFMNIVDGELYYHEETDEWEWLTGNDIYIFYDSFELGVKVLDTWWFAGDIVFDNAKNTEGTIIYDQNGWGITYAIPGNLYGIHWNDYKKLGTIHDALSDEEMAKINADIMKISEEFARNIGDAIP